MVQQEKWEYDDEGLASDFQTLINIARWNYIGIPFIDFLLPYFSKGILGASATEVGVIVSFSVVGVIISSAIAGYMTSKVGSKRLMVIASIGRGCAYLTMYFAFLMSSIQLMMIGAFMKGTFVGIFEVAYEVLIAEKSHKSQRSYAYGKVVSSRGTIFFVGGAIGFSLYGILSSRTDYLFLQMIPMLFFAGAMVWSGFRLKIKIQEKSKVFKPESNEDIKQVEALDVQGPKKFQLSTVSPALIIGSIFLFTSLFLSSLNDSLTNPFIQVYLLEVLDSSFTVVLFAYMPGAVVSFILAPRIGKVADRINPYWGIAIVSIVGAALTWWLVNVTEIWMFSLIFLFDRGFAITGALLVKNVMSRLSIKNRGKNLGYSWSISNIGGVLGPTLGGILWDAYNPRMPFILSIFIELILIFFYLIGLNRSKDYMAEPMDSLTT